MLDSIGQCSSE